MDKTKASVKNLLWYPLETEDAARIARIPALVFSAFGAAIWSIIAIIGLFNPSVYGNWAIVYAILFVLIAWGLLRMRREAAIVGLVVSLIGLFFPWSTSKSISDALMLIVHALAVRGIFAYVRLSQNSKSIRSV